MVLSFIPNVYDAGLHRWIYNTTASIPKGLYRLHHDPETRPLNTGDIAVYMLPKNVINLAAKRRYIDSTHALMKPVAAVAGDYVCTANRQVIVNDVSYGRIQETDSAGRPLPWFYFCGTVTGDLIFTFTSADHSFDSRYYGPLQPTDLLARATPLWTL